MSAEFESGFFVKTPAWHGLGTVVTSAPTVAEALHLAGLDWTVDKVPLYLADGTIVEDAFANQRSIDNKILGVVGSVYSVVQPIEAFCAPL